MNEIAEAYDDKPEPLVTTATVEAVRPTDTRKHCPECNVMVQPTVELGAGDLGTGVANIGNTSMARGGSVAIYKCPKCQATLERRSRDAVSPTIAAPRAPLSLVAALPPVAQGSLLDQAKAQLATADAALERIEVEKFRLKLERKRLTATVRALEKVR
jgi:hypothetical protein